MYQQVLDPVGDSLFVSSLFALVPIVTLFVLIGGLRIAAHIAAPIALLLAMLVAVIVYSMPLGQTLDSAAEGAAFGIFPIMWIVWTAIWIYNMTEATGHFAVLRRAFSSISNDQRIQAVIIAFCFGALLEALAGFGTPVAITAVMLVAVGFQPMKAAAVALVANTAPVAFGAIAIPIVTLSGLTDIPKEDLGAMVGRQTPFLALLVPLILVGMVDGWRGVRAVWPAAVAGGLTFAIAQFACSNYISVELTDIVASLLSAGAIIALLRVWQPSEPLLGERTGGPQPAMAGAAVADSRHEVEIRRRDDDHVDSKKDVWEAFSPYIIIILVFSIAQIGPIKTALADLTQSFDWPGLDILNTKGEPPTSVTYNFNYANAAGTLLFVSGLITMLVLRVSPRRAVSVFGKTLRPAQAGHDHRDVRARAGLRDEPVGADADDRQLDRRRRRGARVLLVEHRLARRGGHRLGHVVELAVRRAPAAGGRQGRPRSAAADGGELLRRRPGQDGLAPEPRDRRRRGRARG